MILSALLTSVGINLGLCFLFFTLYSILRKQPGNVTVYAPRLVAQGLSQQNNDFSLERLLPTAGWVRRAWQPTDEQILETLGLDALVFSRIFVFSLKVFAFAGIVGIFILLPVNYFGDHLNDDYSDFPSKSLDSFSISNVNDGSNRLWVHLCAAYIFTGAVCYLLYHEYCYISSKRIACFYSSKPQPHQYSILVRGIPVSSGSSCSEAVERFFTEYYPSTYLSHAVVRRNGKLQGLINDTEKMCKSLANLKLDKRTQSKQTFTHDGFLSFFGRKVDLLDHYEKKLETLEANVRMEQTSLTGKEVPAAFVSFKTRLGAAIALHIQLGVNPTEWVTERAPEPQDVHWQFFSASFIRTWIFKLVLIFACAVLTILYLIPVVIVQGLANLDQLKMWFPFLKDILEMTIRHKKTKYIFISEFFGGKRVDLHKELKNSSGFLFFWAVVSQVITGYLPSLILQFFLSLVPPIMILLSSMQGFISVSQMHKSACNKVLWFTIWNSFFANVLSGSALYQVNIFLEPKNIPRVLAEAVPAQAAFFISYVVTSGWTGLSLELCRLTPLVCSFLKGLFVRKAADDFEVPSISYHSEIPKILFVGLLGVTYFFLAPLILPFLLVYYCLGYIIYRNQLLNVHSHKFEADGKLWPIVHYSTTFSLVLMHVIAIGIFGLKNLPLASGLTIPLPILTLVFSEYCQKRFVPMFKDYPFECLVKKDREDQNNPTMAQFYVKLMTAYKDPALESVQHRRSMDEHETPLLHTA